MCKIEWNEMQEASETYGEESVQYQNAQRRYLRCMEGIYAARGSHGTAWDERLYKLQQEIQEAWERCVGVLNIPRPPGPPYGMMSAEVGQMRLEVIQKRSVEVEQEIFETSTNAVTFGGYIERAFKETGIKLKDDETFACHICVVKKPTYISEVMHPTPEPMVPMMMTPDSDWGEWPFGVLTASAYRPICYIMEPTIMKQVMKVKEQDKIKY